MVLTAGLYGCDGLGARHSEGVAVSLLGTQANFTEEAGGTSDSCRAKAPPSPCGHHSDAGPGRGLALASGVQVEVTAGAFGP